MAAPTVDELKRSIQEKKNLIRLVQQQIKQEETQLINTITTQSTTKLVDEDDDVDPRYGKNLESKKLQPIVQKNEKKQYSKTAKNKSKGARKFNNLSSDDFMLTNKPKK